MCFQYLSKFFGAHRRRSNAANGGVSPRPSLANAPQMSIETVRTVKSAKSIKSSNASAAGKRGVTVANVSNKMGHSMNSLRLERRQSVAAGSGVGALGNSATAAVPSTADANATAVATAGSSGGSAAVSGAGDNGSPGKRSSWWGFLGIGKKSRSSNESI